MVVETAAPHTGGSGGRAVDFTPLEDEMGILPAPLEAPLLGHRLHGGSATRLWLYGLGMLGSVVYFAQRYPLHGHAPLFKVETEKLA